MKTLIEKKNQIPKGSFSHFTIDHAIHNLSFDEGDLGSMENFNAEDFSSATRIETNKIIEENHLRYDSLKEDNQMFRNQIMIMNEKLDNQAKIQMRLENEIKFEREERIEELRKMQEIINYQKKNQEKLEKELEIEKESRIQKEKNANRG